MSASQRHHMLATSLAGSKYFPDHAHRTMVGRRCFVANAQIGEHMTAAIKSCGGIRYGNKLKLGTVHIKVGGEFHKIIFKGVLQPFEAVFLAVCYHVQIRFGEPGKIRQLTRSIDDIKNHIGF